jgi:predicted DNA binding CopG/RHH family protein
MSEPNSDSVHVNLRLRKPLAERLKQEAAAEGETVATVIRALVRTGLEQRSAQRSGAAAAMDLR